MLLIIHVFGVALLTRDVDHVKLALPLSHLVCCLNQYTRGSLAPVL